MLASRGQKKVRGQKKNHGTIDPLDELLIQTPCQMAGIKSVYYTTVSSHRIKKRQREREKEKERERKRVKAPKLIDRHCRKIITEIDVCQETQAAMSNAQTKQKLIYLGQI